MENASKALIIAGAILISIVLISLGVIILQQGQEVTKSANMSETEVSTFNAKFTQFEGTNVRGSNVKQLYRTVLSHNLAQSDDGRKVSISATGTTVAALATTATTQAAKIGDSGKTYSVTCNYSSSTGLVTSITVTEK